MTFGFEMILIKIKLGNDEYIKYANKEKKWKILRNSIVVLIIIQQATLCFVNLSLDWIRDDLKNHNA